MKPQKAYFGTIGTATSRSVKFWESALQQKDMEQQLITYQQVIAQDFPKIKVPFNLRITSPGEDFNLFKQILSLGGHPTADALIFEKGRIYPTPYWYQGWSIILQNMATFIKQNPLAKPMNAPAAIQLAFHKLKCQQFLQANAIQTPKLICDQVSDYNALMDLLQSKNINQAFIKPYHGSSASGVMAFRCSNEKQMLYTTIELKPDGRLFNNLRLQKYSNVADIKTIVNKMVPAGLLVEEWIRKKKFQKKSVDLRILVINGKAIFVVPRMSDHFITNLHLGNEKGNIEDLKFAWSARIIEAAKALAVNAVHTIGGLFYAGVDVAISNKNVPYVLEVNAFGDMLLNIYHDGKNTYEYELEELLADVDHLKNIPNGSVYRNFQHLEQSRILISRQIHGLGFVQ